MRRRLVMENIHGKMGIIMKEVFWMMVFKEKDVIIGKMEIKWKVFGWTTRLMGKQPSKTMKRNVLYISSTEGSLTDLLNYICKIVFERKTGFFIMNAHLFVYSVVKKRIKAEKKKII